MVRVLARVDRAPLYWERTTPLRRGSGLVEGLMLVETRQPSRDPEHGSQPDQEREQRPAQVAIHGEHLNLRQGLWLAAILIWGLALVFWGFLIRPGPAGPAASDPGQVATPRAMLGLWQAPRDNRGVVGSPPAAGPSESALTTSMGR